jgi:hypothetical protein
MTVRRSDVRVSDRGGDPGLPAAEVSPPPSASTERLRLVISGLWLLKIQTQVRRRKRERVARRGRWTICADLLRRMTPGTWSNLCLD